jgi:hypothetical protein
VIGFLSQIGLRRLRIGLRRRVGLAVVAGLLLVAHGCHGDEDHELFARLVRAVTAAAR